jgi:ERCC4-related helicase
VGALIYGSIIILAMFAVFLIFLYIFNQLHDKHLLQEQQRILALQNKAQKEMFDLQNMMAEKANRRWHDFRFQTNHLIELLEMGGTQAALEYLKENQEADKESNIETI